MRVRSLSDTMDAIPFLPGFSDQDSGPQADMGHGSARSRDNIPNPGDASVQVFLELVLPKPDGADTLPIEQPAHLFVAGTVPADLCLPESTVVFGEVAAAGATMPEAAVDKDGEPCGGKEKVGFAGKVCSLRRPA